MILKNTRTNCGECGISIELQHSLTDIYVCTNCHCSYKKNTSTLNRQSITYSVPEDLTPLRIGSKGKIENTDFEIIGRQRILYNNGYMNFWQAMTTEGDLRYLGESAGFYYWLSLSDQAPGPAQVKNAKAGKQALWSNTEKLFIDQILQYKSEWMEGELQHMIQPIPQSIFMELSNDYSGYALLFFRDKGTIKMLSGSCHSFEYFNLTQLRNTNDW